MAYYAVQAHKHVKECHILCSFSEEAHVLEAGFEGDAFQQFATSVQQVRTASICSTSCKIDPTTKRLLKVGKTFGQHSSLYVAI